MENKLPYWLEFCLGFIGSIGTFMLSFKDEIEWGFRILSLVLGITLAIITIRLQLIRTKNERKNLNSDKDEK